MRSGFEKPSGCTVCGISIADTRAMQISDLAGWVRSLDEPTIAPLVDALPHMLDSFAEIGLGYVAPSRRSVMMFPSKEDAESACMPNVSDVASVCQLECHHDYPGDRAEGSPR